MTERFIVWNAVDETDTVEFDSTAEEFQSDGTEIAKARGWSAWEIDLEENRPDADCS